MILHYYFKMVYIQYITRKLKKKQSKLNKVFSEKIKVHFTTVT